jgi:hypothetical protein
MGATDRRLDALAAGDLQMAAAIRPSFERLGPAAQQLFRRLALVDGPTFDTGMAAALIGQPAWCADRLLDELIDLCLVQPAASGRYTLHELLRVFAGVELAHEPPEARAAAVDRLVAGLAHAAGPPRAPARPVRPAGLVENEPVDDVAADHEQRPNTASDVRAAPSPVLSAS